MELTYLGHSAFQLESDDVTLLVDPWISENPDCPYEVSDFDDVSAVLITHGAWDHIGDAPEIARRNDVDLFCDSASAHVLEERGFPEEHLLPHIWGMEIDRDGWSVKVLQVHHQSSWPDEGVIGPALSYMVTIDGTSVYHMGDTSISRDFELFGDLYEPDVVLIPVGGAEGAYPELYPDEAALVADWMGAPTYVPMHYSNPDHPVEFREHCDDRGVDAEISHMEPGEVLSR